MLLSLLRWHSIQSGTEKLKTKNQRYRRTKNENTEDENLVSPKELGKKCRLI